MSKDKNSSSVRYNSGQNLLCCFCFGRKSQSIASISYDFTNKDEPYDYVVEKLAIKKVPRSLFTTEEDLNKPIKTALNKSSVPNSVLIQKENKPKLVNKVEKPVVKFSSHYNLVPECDVRHTSCSTDNDDPSSDEGLSYKQQSQIRFASFEKQIQKTTEEQELVAHILNTHSSLFTLDPKEAIPKDPENLPNPTIIVPPYVHAALKGKRNSSSHKKQVLLNIQKVDKLDRCPPLKYTTPSSNFRKELSPELKKTINALGVAQKPRFPGLPSKNRRYIESSSTESTEHETFGAEELVETLSQNKANCSSKKVTKSSRFEKETRLTLTDSFSDNSVGDTCGFLTPKAQYSEGIIMFKDQRTKYFTVQQSSHNTNDKSVFTTPMEGNNKIGYPPLDEDVDVSEFYMNDSEHSSKDSQLKAPSLKWKIIIKHHLGDKKDGAKNIFAGNGANSGTDSDHKPYSLNSKGSAPTR